MQTFSVIFRHLFDSCALNYLIQAIKASNTILAAHISALFHQVLQNGDVISKMQNGGKSQKGITRASLSPKFYHLLHPLP